MRKLGLIILVTCYFLTFNKILFAQSPYEENYETGEFASFWSEPKVGSISINSDLLYVHTGNYSAKIVYNNNEDRGSHFFPKFDSDHVYIRWYEYFREGFDFPFMLKMNQWGYSGDFLPLLQLHGQSLGNGDTGEKGVQFVWGDNGPNQDADDIYTSGYITYPIETGIWYCFELEYKLNTPGKRDGIARFWINGELIRNQTNVSIRGSSTNNFNSMWVGGNYSNSNAGKNPYPDPQYPSYRYMDDIVITLDGTRIGPLTGIPEKSIPPIVDPPSTTDNISPAPPIIISIE